MIRPGSEWGTPTAEPPVATVTGDDHALAAWLDGLADPDPEGPGPLVRFVPRRSDLARAVGLRATETDGRRPPRGIALPLDAMTTDLGTAVNSVVLGRRPDRLRSWHRAGPVTVTVDGREVWSGPATTVVVMSGQYLGPADLAPRGHPGDGRLEIQVYALGPRERAGMRRRLPLGTHLPHPRITTTTGRSVTIGLGRPRPVQLDGAAAGPVRDVTVTVRPGALRLLV